MSFKAQCPYCQSLLEMDDQWLGVECKCPRCRQHFVISSRPDETEFAPVQEVREPQAAPEPPVVAPTPKHAAPPKIALPPRHAAPHKISLKTPGGPAYPGTNRAPQAEKTLEARIICPKCGKVYDVNQPGTYSCSCGTSLELLETGAIHVHMNIPRNPAIWYLTGAAAVAGLILTVAAIWVIVQVCF